MLLRALDRFDKAAMLWIVPYQRAPLTALFRLFTYSGKGVSWLVIAVLLNVLHQLGVSFVARQEDFLRAMPCSLLAYLLCIFLKRAVRRKRPPDALTGYRALAFNPTCGSFPSGHAAAAVAFFTALLLISHPAAWAVGVWALLVSFSRYYLGVHYPTDILGGAAIGAGCGLAVNLAQSLLF